MMPSHRMRGVGAALAAALLFGVSTPLAKTLVANISPLVLAGLLYAGSGIGLGFILLARRMLRPAAQVAWPRGHERWWLAAAVAFGGVVGPVLLMLGLQSTAGSAASLLLNLESVFTALIAWFVFRENFDARIALGMALIVIGGGVLVYEPGQKFTSDTFGALAIVGACLCWALDNNFTRKVSGSDVTVVACVKGIVAAAVNLSIAAVLGLGFPAPAVAGAALLVGFAGYGVSFALFVVGLRHLGAARTGAYFSLAPFAGALTAVALLREHLSAGVLTASMLMAVGVWLHLAERHRHLHTHDAQDHAHAHFHDEHHRHAHDFRWDGKEPHTHRHVHEPLTHEHLHYPDLHHRHDHR